MKMSNFKAHKDPKLQRGDSRDGTRKSRLHMHYNSQSTEPNLGKIGSLGNSSPNITDTMIKKAKFQWLSKNNLIPDQKASDPPKRSASMQIQLLD
jgi:hypothetical protein